MTLIQDLSTGSLCVRKLDFAISTSISLILLRVLHKCIERNFLHTQQYQKSSPLCVAELLHSIHFVSLTRIELSLLHMLNRL